MRLDVSGSVEADVDDWMDALCSLEAVRADRYATEDEVVDDAVEHAMKVREERPLVAGPW